MVMDTKAQSLEQMHRPRFGPGLLLIAGSIAVPAMILYGIMGFFRLTPPTAALRDCVREVVPAALKATGSLNIGPATLGLARLGSGMIKDVPPEARQAIRSVKAMDAGVYRLERWLEPAERSRLVVEVGEAMKRRGWFRVATVTREDDMIQIFVPDKNVAIKNLWLSVLVLHEQQLVVASVRGDASLLMEILSKNLDLPKQSSLVAQARH